MAQLPIDCLVRTLKYLGPFISNDCVLQQCNYMIRMQCNAFKKLFTKVRKWGLTKNLYDADDTFEMQDLQLFKSIYVIPNTALITCCLLKYK